MKSKVLIILALVVITTSAYPQYFPTISLFKISKLFVGSTPVNVKVNTIVRPDGSRLMDSRILTKESGVLVGKNGVNPVFIQDQYYPDPEAAPRFIRDRYITGETLYKTQLSFKYHPDYGNIAIFSLYHDLNLYELVLQEYKSPTGERKLRATDAKPLGTLPKGIYIARINSAIEMTSFEELVLSDYDYFWFSCTPCILPEVEQISSSILNLENP
jgi:hypothetical protein